MRIQLFVLSVVLCLSVEAFGQEFPKAEVSAGYSFLRDETIDRNSHGWVGSVAGNLSPLLGIVGEIGGNYNTTQILGSDLDLRIHSFLGGAQFSARANPRITPFAHFLLGVARTSGSYLGTGASTTDFAIQPGGGVDWWMRPKVGVRIGGDYRRIFYDGGDSNEFRIQAGLVLKIGVR